MEEGHLSEDTRWLMAFPLVSGCWVRRIGKKKGLLLWEVSHRQPSGWTPDLSSPGHNAGPPVTSAGCISTLLGTVDACFCQVGAGASPARHGGWELGAGVVGWDGH